jgi:hypothetical protein
MRTHRNRERGQALVETAFALPIFLMLLLGIFDLGRGVYTWNGLSQAAREISRATSVHPGITLGASSETQTVVNTQRALVPGLVNPPTYLCVDAAGVDLAHSPCVSGEYVRVTVSAVYRPVSLLGIAGPITMSSTSTVKIP